MATGLLIFSLAWGGGIKEEKLNLKIFVYYFLKFLCFNEEEAALHFTTTLEIVVRFVL